MTENNKILIVDDNIENLSILGHSLMGQNYTVQVANNGKLAIEMAIKKKPDIILLDISMPEMSGFEVCKELKSKPETNHIPIIFLTAHAATESVVEGFALGAVDYITKPFQEAELISRVKTHLELRNAKAALEQKNKELEKLNATKDKLFSIIAHDLRSPIGVMMQIVELIMDSPEDEKTFQAYMDSQYQLAHSTYFLLNNLLTWAQQNMNQIEFKPQVVDLNSIVDEVLETVESMVTQKNIHLEKNIESNYKVYADEEMLKMIFRNLLTNAAKFTPNDGMVSVNLTTQDLLVKISIKDSGIGISSEEIKKIFDTDEFYSTKGTNSEIGSGLGLKLVKHFIEENNSTLEIESEPNKGSCFSFCLPIIT